MAQSKTKKARSEVAIRRKPQGSFSEVGSSVQRLRAEGQRFMVGIRREAELFARRTRAEIDADVRKLRQDLRGLANASLKDLESRGRLIVGAVEKRLGQLTGGARKGLAQVRLEELPKLAKRLEALEQRIMRLERELR